MSKFDHKLEQQRRIQQLKTVLRREFAHLTKINKSKRPWHLPIIAAIAISFPVFVGVYFGDVASGIKASLGAMIILNLPLAGALPYRMVTVMTWGFAMALCFALGLIAQQISALRLPVFTVMSFGVVILSRYYRQPPPAGLFVVMAGAIALFIPVTMTQVLAATGLVVLGSVFAMVVALLYSLFLLLTSPASTVPTFYYESDTISDSIIVASFVSVALLLAVVLDMPYPYWAAVSCFILIQGMHLRTIWVKQLHRFLGTLVGMGVASWLLSWGISGWGVAIAILLLMLGIESLVDRHYGLAVVFITPLTIVIAEYGVSMPLDQTTTRAVIEARMLDTALGCAVALGGGLTMRAAVIRKPLRRLEQSILKRFSSQT